MKKPYERTVLSPMGEGTIYKTVKQHVAWCVHCDEQIRGNGSIISPYNCGCRTYKYHSPSGEYRAETNTGTNPNQP